MVSHKQLTTSLFALTLATLSACDGGGGGGGQAIDTSPKFQIFTGFDGASGTIKSSNDVAIYKTDGTKDGTVVLKEDVSIYSPGTQSPSELIHFDNGNKIIFAGLTKNEGVEPWVTDGTPNGTKLLKDIAPNASHSLKKSSTGLFGEYKGKVYFTAYSNNDQSFYQTDGTPDNTKALFSYATVSLNHNNLTYKLSADNSGPLTTPAGIYFSLHEKGKSPGAGNTKRVLARYNVSNNDFEFVTENDYAPYFVNGHLYAFNATSVSKISGTSIKPLLKFQIAQMTTTHIGARHRNMSISNDGPLYVLGVENTSTTPKAVLAVFKKDGTVSTKDLKAPSWLSGVTALQFVEGVRNTNGRILQFKDGLYVTSKLQRQTKFAKVNFDGSLEEIKNVGQSTGGIEQTQTIKPIAIFKDFALTETESKNNPKCTGRELWSIGNNKFDLLKNINPNTDAVCKTNKISSYPKAIGKIGKNKFVFVATDGTKGQEAWVTDGSANSIQLLKDINPGAKSGVYLELGDINTPSAI